MARRNPAASAPPDSLRSRKAKLQFRNEFLLALERLAPHALRELAECRLAPHAPVDLPRGGRRIQKISRAPYAWPAYDDWAARHGLSIENPGDDWIRIWAWGREASWLARRKSDSREDVEIPLPDVSASARAYDNVWRAEKSRLEEAGVPSGVRDRPPESARRTAEGLVRRQVLRQTWSQILTAMKVPDARLADLRADLRNAAHLLPLNVRRGKRGRPKKN